MWVGNKVQVRYYSCLVFSERKLTEVLSRCAKGSCCSEYGFCGTTEGYCNAGCQKGQSISYIQMLGVLILPACSVWQVHWEHRPNVCFLMGSTLVTVLESLGNSGGKLIA